MMGQRGLPHLPAPGEGHGHHEMCAKAGDDSSATKAPDQGGAGGGGAEVTQRWGERFLEEKEPGKPFCSVLHSLGQAARPWGSCHGVASS